MDLLPLLTMPAAAAVIVGLAMRRNRERTKNAPLRSEI